MACGEWIAALTFIAVCMVTLTAFPILDGPYISVNDAMDSISEQKGLSVTFACDFQYQKDSYFSIQNGGRIIWKKDGHTVAEWSDREGRRSSNDRYVLTMRDPTFGSFFAALQISSLVAEDQGQYSCHIENGDDVTPSNDLYLEVEYPPSSEYPHCSVLSVGDEKRFVCLSERGSPVVSLQWMKDGEPLQQTLDDEGESFVQVHTTVAGQDAISMGRYECSMTYKESKTGSCFLDRPNVRIQTSTNGLAIGEDLEVICIPSASDNPPVSTFRWEINPSRHHTLGNNGAVLHISNITSHDNGTEIICEGQNAMGRSRARSTIILRPVQTTPAPITIEMEQTEIPRVLGNLASFECRTTPECNSEWLYNGLHIDPDSDADKFFVEGKLNNVLTVGPIAREDVMALVTCYVTVSNRPKTEMYLRVNFSLTTPSPLILPTETSKQESINEDIATSSPYTVSQTHSGKPHTVIPKVDTSRSKEDSSFPNSQIMWYIIGGLMCIVLVGFCCWVSLKAKSLMCDPQRDNQSVTGPALPTTSFQRNGEDFVVRVAMPGEVRPSAPTVDQALMTKEQLVEQEVQYQDLEDVSRQRQTNEYQRLISNIWMPPPLPN